MSERIAFVVSALSGDELSGGRRDATRVYSLLTNPHLGACTLRSPSPFLDCPNSQEFSARFQRLLRGLKTDDQLIFYFTGHGHVINGLFALQVGPTNTELVVFENIIRDFSIRHFKKGIFIIDACHSGAVVGEKGDLNDFNSIEKIKVPRGIAIIASSRDFEKSFELEDGSGSVFTHLLCNGIESGLDNKPTPDSIITIEQIVSFINTELSNPNFKNYIQTSSYKVFGAENTIWLSLNPSGESNHEIAKEPTYDIVNEAELKLAYERTVSSKHPCFGATYDDLDWDLIHEFADSELEQGEKKFEDRVELLNELKLFSPLNSSKILHKAAFLCFSKTPSRIIHQAETVVTIGEPSEKSFVRKDMKGPLSLQIEKTLHFIMANLNPISIFGKGSRRKEEPEIPEEVIREILSNAIAHRDYSINATVQVRLKHDRLEIQNPGSFPSGISWSDLIGGTIGSKPVDAVITYYLVRLKSVERIGRGFEIIRNYLSKNGKDAISHQLLPGPSILISIRRRKSLSTDSSEFISAGVESVILRRKIEISKLPVISPILFGRERELEILDKAWENPQTKILSFVAWGGVGKSALVNAWLNNMEERSYKGAELVYGWSFYSQGTKEKGQASADGFFDDAFKWFGHTGEIPRTQHEKGWLLAEIVSRKKTLLILDGLEPLQYPPGGMHGFLKDKAIAWLLKNLVRNMNGLCIITSRCNVADLHATEGRASLTQNLENLSQQAGMAVLKSYGLKGKDKEFIETSREFKGHALALHLVGSYLKAFRDGDIKQRRFIPKLTEEEKHGGHARRVIESYEKWFAATNKAELDVLYLLGLFDRPAAKDAVDVLRKKPAIKGLTDRLQHLSNKDWQLALNHLRELRLIAERDDRDPEAIDCHPLIREHFGEKLEQQDPDAWKQAHARLYGYYKNLPEKQLPDTLEEMEPLFAAVIHGCLAGKHQEAMDDVYWNRIHRQQEAYLVNKLGAFGADLSCLSGFFETLWDKPVSDLTEAYKAVTLSWAGSALRAVGRLNEAAQPMKAGLEMRISQRDWEQSALGVSNLSELYLTLGDIASAQKYGAQSVVFADRTEHDDWQKISRATHADALHQAGRNKAAEKLFIEAENMQKKRQPEYPWLYSLHGFLFCDLLLSMGKYQEVLERARTTIRFANQYSHLISIALDNLSIGKASMLISVQHSSDSSEAENYINQAVDVLREAGQQDYLPRGLFARSALFRHQKDFLKSWADLDEAREIAEYGQMRLHLTDYHLEACRNIIAQLTAAKKSSSEFEIIENGETLRLTKQEMQAKFKEHFEEAERLVNETGYHRRDPELEELKQ